jgi:hypothetical protein
VNEPIVVISAEIAGLDYHANLERTNELRYELLKLGYSIVGIKQVKDGKSLQSFIVVTNDPDDLVPLAKKFGQKSCASAKILLNFHRRWQRPLLYYRGTNR